MFEELFVPALGQHIQPEPPPVQAHRGIARARHGHARLFKQLAAEFVGNITWVLHRIVERDFFQSMKSLALGKLVEVQRQSRFVFDRPKAACRPFEMNGDIGIDSGAFAHRRWHSHAIPWLRLAAPFILPQDIHAFARNGDLQLEH